MPVKGPEFGRQVPQEPAVDGQVARVHVDGCTLAGTRGRTADLRHLGAVVHDRQLAGDHPDHSGSTRTAPPGRGHDLRRSELPSRLGSCAVPVDRQRMPGLNGDPTRIAGGEGRGADRAATAQHQVLDPYGHVPRRPGHSGPAGQDGSSRVQAGDTLNARHPVEPGTVDRQLPSCYLDHACVAEAVGRTPNSAAVFERHRPIHVEGDGAASTGSAHSGDRGPVRQRHPRPPDIGGDQALARQREPPGRNVDTRTRIGVAEIAGEQRGSTIERDVLRSHSNAAPVAAAGVDHGACVQPHRAARRRADGAGGEVEPPLGHRGQGDPPAWGHHVVHGHGIAGEQRAAGECDVACAERQMLARDDPQDAVVDRDPARGTQEAEALRLGHRQHAARGVERAEHGTIGQPQLAGTAGVKRSLHVQIRVRPEHDSRRVDQVEVGVGYVGTECSQDVGPRAAGHPADHVAHAVGPGEGDPAALGNPEPAEAVKQVAAALLAQIGADDHVQPTRNRARGPHGAVGHHFGQGRATAAKRHSYVGYSS